MLGRKVKETFIFFPVVTLKKVYQLKYGAIGPASMLSSSYPTLSKVLPALENVTIDGKKIEDPVFATSKMNHEKFIGEVEVLAFLTAKDQEYRAEEEIFGQTIMFTVDDKGFLGIDRHIFFSSPENVASIRWEGLPKALSRWDVEKILAFEEFLEQLLPGGLYKALVSCLSDSRDKEMTRERGRIIISLMLFNLAFIHLPITLPFSKTQIILVAAAFEALLNLPSDAIAASFQHAVTTLVGAKTSDLKKWCKEFYDHRSALVHGDVVWGTEETLYPSGKARPEYSWAARHLFVYCLKTKLFLMGLFPEYTRDEFDLDDFPTHS